jgi:hypothetical protein
MASRRAGISGAALPSKGPGRSSQARRTPPSCVTTDFYHPGFSHEADDGASRPVSKQNKSHEAWRPQGCPRDRCRDFPHWCLFTCGFAKTIASAKAFAAKGDSIGPIARASAVRQGLAFRRRGSAVVGIRISPRSWIPLAVTLEQAMNEWPRKGRPGSGKPCE